jgi:hypothetical protein
MAFSPANYRALLHEEVTLPSGAVFTIRKISAMDFLDLGSELPIPANMDGEVTLPTDPAEVSAVMQRARQLISYVEHAVVKGTVAPLLTYERTAQGFPLYTETALHISEMTREDFEALSQAILKKGGLTREVASSVDSFRPNPLSEAPQDAGGDVPRLAESDSQLEHGRAVPGSPPDVPEGRRDSQTAEAALTGG